MHTPFIAGVGVSLFGLAIFVKCLRDFKKSQASETWPSVQGQVSKVRLWGTRLIDGEMVECENLACEYTYSHQGTDHTGSTVAFYTLLHLEIIEFFNSHPEGSKVSVYFNPDNQKDSVLIPGPRKHKRYSGLILASLMTLAGCAVAVSAALGIINYCLSKKL